MLNIMLSMKIPCGGGSAGIIHEQKNSGADEV
jgi:hypothetical protein